MSAVFGSGRDKNSLSSPRSIIWIAAPDPALVCRDSPSLSEWKSGDEADTAENTQDEMGQKRIQSEEGSAAGVESVCARNTSDGNDYGNKMSCYTSLTMNF